MDKVIFNDSKRDFLKKAAYVAPLLVTVSVIPSVAAAGSVKCNNGFGNGADCSPPGFTNSNNVNNRDQDD